MPRLTVVCVLLSAIQYEGMAPNDPAFEPYWPLAESSTFQQMDLWGTFEENVPAGPIAAPS